MIIVEGPDGAGKTTLVRHLCQHFGLKQLERGTKDRSKLYTVTRPDTYKALGAAASGAEPVRVADRLYYSELVYYDLTGRRCEFSPIEQGYIERMIDALACPVILCMPRLSVVQEMVRKEEQMDGVLENVKRIYMRYRWLLTKGHFPEHAIVYDWNAHNEVDVLDQIHEEIETYLIERAARTW